MGNKKVQEKLMAYGIAAGITIGAISGGKMLIDIEDLSDVRANAENIRTRTIAKDEYQAMVREADNDVWTAFDKGIISADDFTRLMKENHSDNFAYENRYKLLDEQTAIEWENSVATDKNKTAEMSLSAIVSGTSLGVAGLLGISLGHKRMKEEQEAEGLVKPVTCDEPTL